MTGTDGKVHVAYELSVLNFSPSVATPTQLETLDGEPDGRVVATVEGEDLAERTLVAMAPQVEQDSEIPVGWTG